MAWHPFGLAWGKFKLTTGCAEVSDKQQCHTTTWAMSLPKAKIGEVQHLHVLHLICCVFHIYSESICGDSCVSSCQRCRNPFCQFTWHMFVSVSCIKQTNKQKMKSNNFSYNTCVLRQTWHWYMSAFFPRTASIFALHVISDIHWKIA